MPSKFNPPPSGRNHRRIGRKPELATWQLPGPGFRRQAATSFDQVITLDNHSLVFGRPDTIASRTTV
jgi:hypothetical protein